MRDFDNDEIRRLAAINRDMDNGKQPFVVWDGSRLAVQLEVMELFKLVSGQTVSHTVAGVILEEHLKLLSQQQRPN